MAIAKGNWCDWTRTWCWTERCREASQSFHFCNERKNGMAAWWAVRRIL